MYTCLCCEKVEILKISGGPRSHVKRYHKNKPKSGDCPHCSNTFGSIYNCIQHVDKYHVANVTESSRKEKKRKKSVNSQEKNKIIRILASSDNTILEINPTSSTPTILDFIDLPDSEMPLPENNDIPIDDGIISGIEYFDEESPFDLQLLGSKEWQSDIATQVIVDLLANVTLSRSIVREIISTFVEYQRASIEELRKIDSHISENEKNQCSFKIHGSFIFRY